MALLWALSVTVTVLLIQVHLSYGYREGSHDLSINGPVLFFYVHAESDGAQALANPSSCFSNQSNKPLHHLAWANLAASVLMAEESSMSEP